MAAKKKQGTKQGKQGKQGKTQGKTAYTGGLYAIGEAFIRSTCKGIVTRSALVAHLADAIRVNRKDVTKVPTMRKKATLKEYMSDERILSAAGNTATVLLSPREVGKDQSKAKKGQILSESGRGDCRGNFSAMGCLYFMQLLNRKTDKDGNKEEQKYRWGWRKEALAKHVRPVTDTQEVKAAKTSKTATKVVAKTAKTAKTAKKTVKATAKKTVKAAKKAAPKADPIPAVPADAAPAMG